MVTSSDLNWQNNQSLELISSRHTIEKVIYKLRDLIGVEHIVYHSSHLGSNPLLDPFIRLTYPAEWIKRYLQMDYVKIDPVLRNGFLRALPFFWSDIELSKPEEFAMLSDAISHGVGPFGYSIPVRSKHGHRGLFSLSSSSSTKSCEEFCSRNTRELVEIANALHKRVLKDEFGEDVIHLSPREVECLRWTSEGKDAGDISKILCLSIHTTREYLKSARFKLDCLTLAQAVNKAIRLGLL